MYRFKEFGNCLVSCAFFWNILNASSICRPQKTVTYLRKACWFLFISACVLQIQFTDPNSFCCIYINVSFVDIYFSPYEVISLPFSLLASCQYHCDFSATFYCWYPFVVLLDHNRAVNTREYNVQYLQVIIH